MHNPRLSTPLALPRPFRPFKALPGKLQIGGRAELPQVRPGCGSHTCAESISSIIRAKVVAIGYCAVLCYLL